MKNLGKVILIFSLLFSFSFLVVQGGSVKRTNPEVETIVFVDYKSPSHAGPGPHPTTCSGNYHFTRGGLRWPTSTVTYDIDETTIPDNLNPSEVTTAITNSFVTWKEAEPDSPTFSEVSNATNTISWQSLGTTGVVAYTSISYLPWNKEIISFNIVFNKDLPWSTSGEEGKFDVQNVVTHEIGHALGLDHVNAPQDGLETMYRYTQEGETIKRDLCTGDIVGIQALY